MARALAVAPRRSASRGKVLTKCCPYSAEWQERLLGFSARKLAAAAKVSPETVIRFERGEKLRKRTVDSLRQVLEAAGLEFTDGRKPGVRVSANLGR